jgi:hypothetical protein
MSPRSYGRHVEHDPRSLAYALPVLPRGALRSVRWTRRIPILDQLNLGSCTCNAGTGALGTDSAGRTAPTAVTISPAGAAASHGFFTSGEHQLDEAFAVRLYSLATRLDDVPGQYPPEDTGSTSLGVAKALKALGLASAYRHAFSLDAVRSGLQTGPLLLGIPWYYSMETPEADGQIPLDPASGVAGGHEVLIDEYDAERDRFWIANSWGAGWGVGGRGYLTASDLQQLLAQQGDVVALAFATAPTPDPAPPAPATGFAAALRAFLAAIRTFVAQAEAWLTSQER